MPRNPTASWFPRLVGAALALLAFATWSFEPNDRFILPGFAVSGPLGQLLGVLQFVLLAVLAWGCYAQRRFAAAGVLALVGYIVASLWVWVAWFADPGRGSFQSLVIATAFLTGILLAFGRALWQRRTAFEH